MKIQEKTAKWNMGNTGKCRNRQLYTELSAWIPRTDAVNCPCFERTGNHGQYKEHKGSSCFLRRKLRPQLPGCSTNAQYTLLMNVGNVCRLSNIVLLE